MTSMIANFQTTLPAGVEDLAAYATAIGGDV
jgi:hypothetical protein